MSISVNPGYHYCPSAKRNVSVEQTEGQCRERHNCADGACPLEAEFGQSHSSKAYDFLMPASLRAGAKAD
jgi:hypothetical protein